MGVRMGERIVERGDKRIVRNREVAEEVWRLRGERKERRKATAKAMRSKVSSRNFSSFAAPHFSWSAVRSTPAADRRTTFMHGATQHPQLPWHRYFSHVHR